MPLTLMQYGVHLHTGVDLGWVDVANNFLVANAIYDADRMDGPVWSPQRTVTHASALLSTAYYAADEHTAVLAAMVVGLHFGYSTVKPWIAPTKPFVVAFLWTLAIYYAPLWRFGGIATADVLTPAALFLSITSLSHASDVVDEDDDRTNGVRTPAVLMGRMEGIGYAISCGLAAAWLHSRSSFPLSVYDELALAVVAGIVFDNAIMLATLVSVALVAEAAFHRTAVVQALLQSTEVTHSVAISLLVDGVRGADVLPPPMHEWAVELLFRVANIGDRFGSTLLDVYHQLVRNGLGHTK